MEHFRYLYKTNGSLLSPKNCKRKAANEIRASKRSELYTSTRNISPSPSPKTNHLIEKEDLKENFKPPNPVELKTLLTPEAPEANSKVNEKLSRQKAHLFKFLAWKTEKAKQAQLKDKLKRAPFVVPTRYNAASTAEATNNIKKSFFAPSNHIFRPPANLKDLEVKIVGVNSIRCINGKKQETYHFVETPKKKTDNCVSSCRIATLKSSYVKPTPKPPVKPTPKAVISKPVAHKTPVVAQKVTTVSTEPKSKLLNVAANKKTPNVPKQNANAVKPSLRSTPSAAKPLQPQQNKKAPVSQSKPLHNGPPPPPRTVKTPLRPPPAPTQAATKPIKAVLPKSKPNPPSQQFPKPNLRSQTSTANQKTTFPKSKAGLPPIKRSTFKAPKKTGSSISNAFMEVASNTRSRAGDPPSIKLGVKSVLQKMPGIVKSSEPIPETPTDENHVNPYLQIVTSTKRKSFPSKESSANSLFVEMNKLVSPVDDATTCPAPADGNKFNFLRFSIVQSDEKKPEEAKEKTQGTDEVHVTPDKAAAGPQTPTTYLSPYVSVSRGKVGIKIEREKRNSIYMSVDNSITDDPETTSKVRHTLATVHYYRKQLADEINRLNCQCDVWTEYKEANAQLVEDSGLDMINVTIGQTKLLTTKKLKQFGDLIDRCEDGVMGKKSFGKGDGAKPILTEDLEGFWSMVGLQIENVDKRFANLQRWKENNWKDPDEVPTKSASSTANAKKIKKRKPVTTAGRNRDLQKILKNAQAAFLRKKTANGGVDEDVILTPSMGRKVLIRDRRSMSAAATVIKVGTPSGSRKSSAFDQTTPTGILSESRQLPVLNGFRKSLNLFKSTLLSEQEKKSPATNNCATPYPLSRKSILKTPGSIRQPKSVIFNSPTLKFTMEDKVDDESPPRCMLRDLEEEQKEERTYTLRNRNVRLRDSAEIIIPKYK